MEKKKYNKLGTIPSPASWGLERTELLCLKLEGSGQKNKSPEGTSEAMLVFVMQERRVLFQWINKFQSCFC